MRESGGVTFGGSAHLARLRAHPVRRLQRGDRRALNEGRLPNAAWLSGARPGRTGARLARGDPGRPAPSRTRSPRSARSGSSGSRRGSRGTGAAGASTAAQRVDGAVRADPEVRVRAVVAGQPGHPAVLDPEHGGAAALVGCDDQPSGVHATSQGQRSQPGATSTGSPPASGTSTSRMSGAWSGRRTTHAGTRPAGRPGRRRARRARTRVVGQHPALAGGHVDRDERRPPGAARARGPPGRDDRGAVEADVVGGAAQRFHRGRA